MVIVQKVLVKSKCVLKLRCKVFFSISSYAEISFKAQTSKIIPNARAILVKVTRTSLELPLVLKLSFPITKESIFSQASAEKCLPAVSSSLLLPAVGYVTWPLARPSCLRGLSQTFCLLTVAGCVCLLEPLI